MTCQRWMSVDGRLHTAWKWHWLFPSRITARPKDSLPPIWSITHAHYMQQWRLGKKRFASICILCVCETSVCVSWLNKIPESHWNPLGSFLGCHLPDIWQLPDRTQGVRYQHFAISNKVSFRYRWQDLDETLRHQPSNGQCKNTDSSCFL